MVIDRSVSVDVTAKDRLFVVDEYLTPQECDIVQAHVDQNIDRSFDRTTWKPNTGINGDVGKYRSFLICEEVAPVIWSDIFSGREINELPLDTVVVNIYNRGDFIPPHRDKQASIYTVTVPLQTSDDRLIFSEQADDFYSSQNSDEHAVVCKDVRGKGYGFYGNSPLHWVPEVTNDLRVSLICLYGAVT